MQMMMALSSISSAFDKLTMSQ